MARLTLCPHCDSPASLPPEIDDSTLVMCTTCGKTFAAAESAVSLASLMGQTEPVVTENPSSKSVDLDDLFGLGKKSATTVESASDASSAAGGFVPVFDNDEDDEPVANFEIKQQSNEADVYEPTVATATAKVTARTKPKRRYSKMPLVVGVILGQLLAFAGGYCAVMWIQYARGDQRIDPWGLAAYYPESVLPPGARDTTPVVADSNSVESEPTESPTADDPERIELANYEVDAPTDASATTVAEAPAPLAPDPVAAPMPSGQFALPGAPRYSTADINEAIAIAKETMPTLLEGEFANPELRRAKGLSYATICRLAHVMNFYDPTAADYDTRVELEAQEQVFKRLLSEPNTRNDIATITKFWLASDNRQTGVFFAGEVSGGKPAGPVFEYQVKLPSGDSITVVRRKHLAENRFQNVDAVGFIGEVIDHPTERIVGYRSEQPWVVWAEHVVPIDTPAYAREAKPGEVETEADPLGGFDLGPLPEIDL